MSFLKRRQPLPSWRRPKGPCPRSLFWPNGASPAELLQCNLSQPVACVVIGCEQMAALEQNVHAALDFTPISESGRKLLQQKVAPSRSAWQNFLRAHDDAVSV